MNLLIKEYTATAAAIEASRFVKFDGTDKTKVLKAAAATDAIVGVSQETVATAASERISITHLGVVRITAGAAFNPGALLTSDSSGRAVAAAPSAGTNNRVGAVALEEATAAGDLVLALVNPISTQG